MTVEIPKARLAELQAQHPEFRVWVCKQAPRLDEMTDLIRRGFRFVEEKDGLRYYGRR